MTGLPQRGDDALLVLEDVVVEYPVGAGKRGRVQAVSGVSLEVHGGETVGLVGESGCGKSTLGRAVTMLTPPTAGRVRFDGVDLTSLSARDLRRLRRKVQMIFQDPISSLNDQRRIRDIVAEGLSITKAPKPWDDRIESMLLAVGLDADAVGARRPRELSGGQCQRVAIARALMLDPALLVCDEPVSALDVSVQAQILNLLKDMKARYELTMLFISHDLAVVGNICDRIVVMYLGKVCEIAPAAALYAAPAHPYTQALLSAVPRPDPSAALEPMRIGGELPSPLDPPSGCRFRTRCPYAQPLCAESVPALREVAPGQIVACHFAGDLPAPRPAERAPSASVPPA